MQSIRTALRLTSAVRPSIAGRNVVPPAMVRAYHEKDTYNFQSGYALKANLLKLIDHYSNPRNVGSLNRKSLDVGTGLVGAPACGDVIRLDIQVDEATGKITETRFKTFGCGSAIASSSYLTTLLKGKTLEEASKISNTQIASELCLPPVKLHCSLLAEDAVTAAIKNYRSKRAAPATDLSGTAKEIPKEAAATA